MNHDIHSVEERDTDEKQTCPDCEGTGILVVPAYSSAGKIIDEEQYPCGCTVQHIND